MINSKIIEDLILTLTALNDCVNEYFSGIGLVLYHDLTNLSPYHCNLIEDVPNLPVTTLGSDELIGYLKSITSYQHPYHDGFHFINSQGLLTHIAQFFSPPIQKQATYQQKRGARTFCSLCGSQIPGVIMIGTISSQHQIDLYKQGKLVTAEYSVVQEEN